MKTNGNGLSGVLVVAAVAGLSVLLASLAGSANSSSVSPNASPVATLVGQVSPLATPSVPLAIGAPVVMRPTGRLGRVTGDRTSLLSVVKNGEYEHLATFDPVTGQERRLLDKNPWWPRLSGHWLAYVDQQPLGSARYSYQIKVLDTNTGKEVSLAKGDAIQKYPDISGDTVVWMDSRNQDLLGPDIYVYDLTSKKETPVVGGLGNREFPKISGEWVIYLQWKEDLPDSRAIGSSELRAHSLLTGEDFAIGPTPRTQDSFYGTYHAIDGDKVAWTKFNVGTYSGELHLYDLKTRADRQLTEPHNLGPALLSISAQAGLVAYNDAGPWITLDYLQPTPAAVSINPPAQISGGYELSVAGAYVVWQIPLNNDFSYGQIYAAQITR